MRFDRNGTELLDLHGDIDARMKEQSGLPYRMKFKHSPNFFPMILNILIKCHKHRSIFFNFLKRPNGNPENSDTASKEMNWM